MGTTTLTFLGLAGDPSIPEWGVMLNEGRAYLVDAPWLAFIPGLAISLTILSVHRIGEWIGEAWKT
jgi:peptide/nickel transport system permease protein